MTKALFQKIIKALPTFPIDTVYKRYIALDIYLTAVGARTACTPFDGIKKVNGEYVLNGEETLAIAKGQLDKLKQIRDIVVLVGPLYGDGLFTETIMIVNRKKYNTEPWVQSYIQNILDQDAQSERLFAELHGYVCASTDYYKVFEGRHYNVIYRMEGLKHFGSWCPHNEKSIKDAVEYLNVLQHALRDIQVVVTLEIETYQKKKNI
jgi:hypothetical protein